MKTHQQQQYSTMVRGKLVIILIIVLAFTYDARAQKILLTPSDSVKNIAYIDYSRLRKEYKAFTTAMEQSAHKNETKIKAYEAAIASINKQTNEQLKIDSTKGSKDREKILSQDAEKKIKLASEYEADFKKMGQEVDAIIKQYENKIATATEMVTIEGGFTDIRPIIKEPFEERGKNVTDLVLAKLN